MCSRCQPRRAPNCSTNSEPRPYPLGLRARRPLLRCGTGRLVRRRLCREFLGAERAALIALGDRVLRLPGLGGEDLGGIGLAVVLRFIAKAISVRIVVPGALIA